MDERKELEILLDRVKKEEVDLCWDRYEMQTPQCKFGLAGLCCRMCIMGPCVIGGRRTAGVCGATAETIAARHWSRMVAAGMAAHTDHGREMVHAFISAAKGELTGYGIKDETKLQMIAEIYAIQCEGRKKEEIALELGDKILGDFGRQHGEITLLKRAPIKRQQLWKKENLTPRGIDLECVEMIDRTTMGNDQDYKSLVHQSMRCALANGWGGSMVATELTDIIFGTPVPLGTEANLAVLEKDQVNIVVHGHEPVLAEYIVAQSKDQDLLKEASLKGAKGINITGLCCTANEVLLRHGVRPIGGFSHQELAILTGAVEAMVVDVQCIMQSLPKVAQKFHTKIITTSPRAKIEGAQHIEFSNKEALNVARKIIKTAIENFPNRKTVMIPVKKPSDIVVGFSHETINYMLGGTFRGSYWPLNDNIINGRILGVAGVVGCDRPLAGRSGVTKLGNEHVKLVRELIAHDILVVETGCAAHTCLDAGLLVPEAARFAGAGLAEVCKAVGMPPVLHAGACVDNSRILIALSEMVKVGGLGEDISDLPVAGCCPTWITEKAIAIGQYFVASGVFTVFGGRNPIEGSKPLSDLLCKGLEGVVGGYWAFEDDPHKMAQLMIEHIKKKRDALKLRPMMYEPVTVEG